MNQPPTFLQRLCFLVAFLLFVIAAIQASTPVVPVTPWLIPGGLAALALGAFVPW